jgi:penicillin-binding protein 2
MRRKDGAHKSFDFDKRTQFVFGLIIALFVGMGVRFWFLQVAQHHLYEQRAENNRIREIPILAPRGNIVDRNGVVLVDNTPAFNVIVTPELIENRPNTLAVLEENLGVDRERLLAELSDPRRPKTQPILVKQNATPADKSWVYAHEYEHPEIIVDTEPQRIYPFKSLAAHILGYIGEISEAQLEDPRYIEAGYKAGDIIGLGGIEKYYDKILRGKDGVRRVMVDSRGRAIRDVEKIEPIKGQDIVTTIDVELQRVAEAQFDDKGETGAAIAMNPQNGEILAMVSAPAFDPNIFAENVASSKNRSEIHRILTDPEDPLFNKAIRGIYPTGSTWKLMMATAALEEGVITLDSSRIACGGGLQLGNKFMHCMGSHGTPEIHAAIVHSCDGYFYRLGLKMGVDMIHDWVVRFGMGHKTGIDLPNEESGIIPDREWKKRHNPRDPVWKDFDTAEAAVGQGSVAVPPLQLLRAEAGIMMGGEYHVPHILKEAKGTTVAPLRYFDDKSSVLNLSPRTVDAVSYAAWGVVNEGGTGSSAALPGVNMGGKTGTAQVIAKEKAKGKNLQDQSWFISFAPLHTDSKPELAVVVLTEHGGQGGRASAPKSKAINAAYFSKKLGRQLLPNLVASLKRPPND